MCNQKEKLHIIPKSPGLIITLLLFLVVEIIFLSLLIALDILPTILNVVIVIVFIGLTVLIFKLLINRKEVTKQRKIGVILSIVLMVLMGIGSFYLFTTYAAFSHMSDADNQYEEFYVVASRHGSYKKVDDIKGRTVYTYQSTSMAYDSAKEKLQKKVKVKYEDAGGYMNLKGKLLDDENKEHDEIIFLSSSNYEMICDYAEDFKKKNLLINFWASWGDSISNHQSNTELKEIYQKYKKNKHIAMLGISLDIDKQEWQDAIKRDTLNWEQVCDFGGLNSEVAKQYAIKQVPSNILLSADGKILAKNLKGEQLKKKIEEVVTAAEEKEKQDNKKKK